MIKHYDIVIVGGGIAGAGIAQAASAEGYSVLLLEKGDFGNETSSRSSKLIHGGLRYLESGQLRLVFSALSQRKQLLKLAPSLVKATPFYIPVYKNSNRGIWSLYTGLLLYALLGLLTPLSRFKRLAKKDWQKLNGIKKESLIAVFRYWDGQTDDKKLTHAVIHSAQELGAQTLSHCPFISANKNDLGYSINYQKNNTDVHANCSMLINAAGPWINTINNNIYPPPLKPSIDWIQGTHIIIDQPEDSHILYLESHLDNRVVFVMPWQGSTLIGTTETPLMAVGENIQPKQEEIDYLISIYHHYFPQKKLKVTASFAGVRVLPSQAKNAFSRPREVMIFQDKETPTLITLCGGKLTTFRATSKLIVKRVKQQLGDRVKIADIDNIILK